jgi:hypothetical protein
VTVLLLGFASLALVATNLKLSVTVNVTVVSR